MKFTIQKDIFYDWREILYHELIEFEYAFSLQNYNKHLAHLNDTLEFKSDFIKARKLTTNSVVGHIIYILKLM